MSPRFKLTINKENKENLRYYQEAKRRAWWGDKGRVKKTARQPADESLVRIRISAPKKWMIGDWTKEAKYLKNLARGR